jgi:hypothetical protein
MLQPGTAQPSGPTVQPHVTALKYSEQVCSYEMNVVYNSNCYSGCIAGELSPQGAKGRPTT